uniref:Vasoactive intestinal peptide receptor 1a n=1 Tax=Mastacembelus armatus TaxID=205130 RepID=A0A7N8YBU9_9TELE
MFSSQVFSVQNQMCDMMSEIERERDMCEAQIENKTTGCSGTWDKITCWPSANIGEVVTIPCPKHLLYLSTDVSTRNLSKTCTKDGWTIISIETYIIDCGYDPNNTIDDNTVIGFCDCAAINTHFLRRFSGWVTKTSHPSSSLDFCLISFFRKLHCTRNYIHMHLFVSFILKAIAIFVKDVVLYHVGEMHNCQSTLACKAAVVFFQFGIMASYFWLLVEGLYLHALLAVSVFSERKYFWWYILIGWGAPTIFISAWVITKAYLNDSGCWDIIDESSWWIIKIPILVTILVNFVLFICIIRILRQKMNCPDIGRKESNQYSRLAKSTLLLIPLFGINYTIFAFIPDNIHAHVRMVFDLILGSFQVKSPNSTQYRAKGFRH